jgi:hypothetical protein
LSHHILHTPGTQAFRNGASVAKVWGAWLSRSQSDSEHFAPLNIEAWAIRPSDFLTWLDRQLDCNLSRYPVDQIFQADPRKLTFHAMCHARVFAIAVSNLDILPAWLGWGRARTVGSLRSESLVIA